MLHVTAGLALFLIVPTAAGQAPVSPSPAVPATATPSGIPLDAPWKVALYRIVEEKLQHSAWGRAHYERDYALATALAREEHLVLDTDVLFAAAFLHDVGVFEPWRKDGVDHCDRAAEVAPELLAAAGFPATKVEAVQEAVRQHMYYRPDAKRPEAVVLHDADTLDFLGAIGVARIVSLTSRHRWAGDLAGAVKTLQGFHDELPGKVVTTAGRHLAQERAAEGKALLAALRAEALDGKAY